MHRIGPKAFDRVGPGEGAPALVNVVVEVPTGSRVKYEMEPQTGLVRVDRVLYSPFHYPAEYGFIPGTSAPDGEQVDILVLINGSTFPGVVLRARPVAILRMQEESQPSVKVLAVAADDPSYAHIGDHLQLPPHFLLEVEHFFLTYKNLQNVDIRSEGWRGRSEAESYIREAIEVFRRGRA